MLLKLIKFESMENNYGLIDLTENELKEKNGGMVSTLYWINPFAFWKGIIEGWQSSTQF